MFSVSPVSGGQASITHLYYFSVIIGIINICGVFPRDFGLIVSVAAQALCFGSRETRKLRSERSFDFPHVTQLYCGGQT